MLIFLLASGGYGYLYYRARDIAPIDDSDLRPQKIVIPDNENSYFELAKIKDVIYYPTDGSTKISDMADGKNWDGSYAKDLITKNEQALSYFDQFDQKPKFIAPLLADPDKVNINTIDRSLSVARQIARIQAIKSQILFQEGKKEEAFNEAIKIVHLGYKLSNYQPNLIQYLVGLTVNKIGWNRLDTIIMDGNLSPEFLKSKKPELVQYKSVDEGFKTALQMEYISMSQVFIQLGNIDASRRTELNQAAEGISLSQPTDTEKELSQSSKIMPKNFYYQPNKTVKIYAELIRAAIQSPCDQIANTSTASTPTSKIKLIFTENAIGKILTDMIKTSLTNLPLKKCEVENLAEQVLQKIP